jgi:hypothetical protein
MLQRFGFKHRPQTTTTNRIMDLPRICEPVIVGGLARAEMSDEIHEGVEEAVTALNSAIVRAQGGADEHKGAQLIASVRLCDWHQAWSVWDMFTRAGYLVDELRQENGDNDNLVRVRWTG